MMVMLREEDNDKEEEILFECLPGLLPVIDIPFWFIVSSFKNFILVSQLPISIIFTTLTALTWASASKPECCCFFFNVFHVWPMS